MLTCFMLGLMIKCCSPYKFRYVEFLNHKTLFLSSIFFILVYYYNNNILDMYVFVYILDIYIYIYIYIYMYIVIKCRINTN